MNFELKISKNWLKNYKLFLKADFETEKLAKETFFD